MKKFIISNLKRIIVAIAPYAKYCLFLWIAWFPSKDLYFKLFDAYVNKYFFFLIYFSVCIFVSYCANKNKELGKLKWGKVAYDYLIVELFFFALFAQHYVIVSILIVVATIVFSIWFHCYVEMHCKRNIRKYHNRASAVVCLLLCLVLLIPSFTGIDKEYISTTITSEEWEEFVASFETDYGGNTEEEVFEKYDSIIAELTLWDDLNTDERVTILNKVVLIEKENLGIEATEIVVINDKLGEYTCGYYSDKEKQIYLNISQISGEGLQDNLRTVCHEVFHAYEHYVVENIDFDSNMVKSNYYFMNARKWKDNINKYVPGIVDYDMYSEQPLEADARQYAEERVNAYIEKMNNA